MTEWVGRWDMPSLRLPMMLAFTLTGSCGLGATQLASQTGSIQPLFESSLSDVDDSAAHTPASGTRAKAQPSERLADPVADPSTILIAGQPVSLPRGIRAVTFADGDGLGFPRPIAGWRRHYGKRNLGQREVDEPGALKRAVHQVVIQADGSRDSRAAHAEMLEGERSTHFMIDWDGTIYQSLDPIFAARNGAGAGTISVHLNNRLRNLRRWRHRRAAMYSEGHPALAAGSPAAHHRRSRSAIRRINGMRVKSWGYTDAQYSALIGLLSALTRYFPNIAADFAYGPRGTVSEHAMTRPEGFSGILAGWHWDDDTWAPGPGLDWSRLCGGLVGAGARSAPCPEPYVALPTTGPEDVTRADETVLVLDGTGTAELLGPDQVGQRIELPWTGRGLRPGLYRLWLGGVENAFVLAPGSLTEASVPLDPRDYDAILIGGVRYKVGGGVPASALDAPESLAIPRVRPRGYKRLYHRRQIGARRLPPTLQATAPHVRQVVLHADITPDSEHARGVLVRRRLSTHFYIDWDGVLWQGVDPVFEALHAGSANAASIGIDLNLLGGDLIENPGLPMYSRRHPEYQRMSRPEYAREISAPMAINRDDHEEPPVQSYGYTEAQYRTLHELLLVLMHAFPNIGGSFPTDSRGRIIRHVLADRSLFAGIIGHWHSSRNKWDPGPGFDWNRVCRMLRRDGVGGAACPLHEGRTDLSASDDVCLYPTTYNGH